ncbi:MAG: hypothetical protein EOM34_09115 [Clostridia bacterium]|nr:hypothetical protein [Lachnospiraceae bacterium]NCC00825.1 hypothetical protein [Clostridia bacterium]NCD02055.1 hypothetical protein [Clostridia bacterium]
MKYYKCWLENGKVLDFDKKCVEVNWNDDMFMLKDAHGAGIAIIPIIVERWGENGASFNCIGLRT